MPLVRFTAAFFFYVAATAVRTFPLFRRFTSHIPGDLGDPLLNTWILAWDYHALTTDPFNLFHGNIFYPAPYTLALSEHMLANLPIFALAYAVTGNPVFAYNAVFFLSFVLSSFGLFLLVYYWTRSFWASLVAGFLFGFAPVRFAQISHIQLLNFFWAPLVLLLLDRFLRSRRWWDLVGLTLSFCLQFLTSVYLGYMTAVAAGVYLLATLWLKRELFSCEVIVKLGVWAIASCLILFFVHLPYLRVSQEWGLRHSPQECVRYSADFPLSYLAPYHRMNHLYRSLFAFANAGLVQTGDLNERQLFPGFLLPFLTGLGLCLPSSLPRAREIKVLFGSLLVAALLLSFGPFLTFFHKNTYIPLPYLGLYVLVPGFASMRVPARFAQMAFLAASVLASLGALWIGEHCKRLQRFPLFSFGVGLALMGLYTFEAGLQPLPLEKVPTGQDLPAVYRWLASQELNGAVLEVPMNRWQDNQYMYFSTYHWRSLINGTSGFYPPTYTEIIKAVRGLPSLQAVKYLSALGVTTIVVHLDLLEAGEQRRWDDPTLASKGLERIKQFGRDVVYKLTLRQVVSEQLEVDLNVPLWMSARIPVTVGVAHTALDRAWVHPQPLRRLKILTMWEEVETGKILTQRAGTTQLPLVVLSGERVPLGVTVNSPARSGRYRLKVLLPDLGLATHATPVEVREGRVPTSQNAPHLLSASYAAVEEMPVSFLPSHPRELSLRVVNAGQAVWLAKAPENRGAVRLSWSWGEGVQGVPYAPREFLVWDVFPGQTYVFKVTVTPPADPGEYILEFDLVSEHVAWFRHLGVKPLQLKVKVAP